MKTQLFLNKVSVKKSPIHGYGVFADKKINTDEIVEECHVIKSDGIDNGMMNYYFDADGAWRLMLGYGSIYNHSQTPNARYFYDAKYHLITIKAARIIEKDEEIFIDYGKNWFSSRGLKAKKPSVWRRLLNPATSILMRGLIGCALILGSIHLINVGYKVFYKALV